VIDLTPLVRFGIGLVRPGVLVAFAPALGGTYAPSHVKIGLAVLIAAALAPVLSHSPFDPSWPLALVVAREVGVGAALALAIRALVAGAELGGHLAGFQMGLSYGATVDPQSGVRNPLLAVLYGNIALVSFLVTNGHHALIRALGQSYVDLPMGTGGISPSLPGTIAQLLGLVFLLGARIAAPVVIVLVLTEVAMAVVARSAPMLNVNAVGAPIRLLLGMAVLALVVPAIVGMASDASASAFGIARHMAGTLR
jgi:flagellar biosynthetic protein FliR